MPLSRELAAVVVDKAVVVSLLTETEGLAVDIEAWLLREEARL